MDNADIRHFDDANFSIAHDRQIHRFIERGRRHGSRDETGGGLREGCCVYCVARVIRSASFPRARGDRQSNGV